MKRNSVLVLGLGILLGAGLLAPGCSDDDKGGTTPSHDSGIDSKGIDASRDTGATGGVKGTGGALGTGGAVLDGAIDIVSGTGGAVGGAPGTGGSTGAGGSIKLDGGVDLGTIVPVDGGHDATTPDTKDAELDIPITNPDAAIDQAEGIDGTVIPQVDTGSLDGGIDSTVVSLDAGIDGSIDVEIDVQPALDAQVDTEIDAEIDSAS